MFDMAMIHACAPNVAPSTIVAVIQVESGGDALALASNRADGAARLRPQDIAEAVRLASAEIRAGNSVDVGLMQINSGNFQRLGITIAEAFNPCRNIQAGATILSESYGRTRKDYGDGQAALRATLSEYNTGDKFAGFHNGYVARYYAPRDAKTVVPSGAASIYTADPTVFNRTTMEGIMNEQLLNAAGQKPVTVTDAGEFLTPGVQVELDPNQADLFGVVEETALSAEDAWESQADPHDMQETPAQVVGSNVVVLGPARSGMTSNLIVGARAWTTSPATENGGRDGD